MWVSYAFCGFRIRIVVYWPHVNVDDVTTTHKVSQEAAHYPES